nr:protein dispatched homolog 3 isoform X1 [Pogona vitticeps]
METEEDPLFQGSWLNEDEEGAFGPCKRVEGPRLCGTCRWNPKPRVTPGPAVLTSSFWNVVGLVFTNPYSAGLVLFLGCAIPAALTLAMFLHYPALDIDISYNAFEIRNHESSQRFDALASALKSQFGSWGRSRRDVADFNSETLQKLIFEQLQNLRRNASRLAGVRRGRRSATLGRVHPPLPPPPTPPNLANRTTRRPRNLPPHWEYPNAVASANTQSHAHWRIELIFLARGDAENNIFTSERLLTIHEIERRMMDHPRFQQFCWKPHEVLKDLPLGSYSYCSPPSSLMTYFFPTERGGKIYYDGLGQDLADIRGSLELAMTHPEFYWYVDEGLSAENMKSSLLRSEILFGAPLPSYSSVEDRWEEQRRKFQSFVVTYVALLAKQSTSKVQVLYGGTDLFDYEVRKTFNNDMLLAFISSSCIAVLVYILASCSVFLSFFGIASIGLSCLVALFLYHVVFGIQYLGILNGVAAFVIVGIGVDDVFVFINTYRQATHLKDPNLRMIHTIQTAGKATFFTSLTTAAAYAANIFSQIPAVHDFGLFMSLIVSCCWVAVLFTMPAALGIWSLYLSPLEDACQTSCSQKCVKESTLHVSDGLFVSSESASGPGPESLPYLDDDIPLLNVEEEPVALEMGDVPLVSVLPDNLSLQAKDSSHGQLIAHLQEILHHWALWSAVKSKWVIVGLFLSVLILSIIFAGRLRPASRAPLLFRPDTNIQVLLDLKYNLSAEGISCVTCSGLFQEKPHNLQSNIRTSLEKKKRGSGPAWGGRRIVTGDAGSGQDLQGTVYIFKSKSRGKPAVYRFSLNATAPAPWQAVSAGDGEVPSFQVYRVPYGNFTKRLTACVSTGAHAQQTGLKKWMVTSGSCDTRRGWKFDFSFYVAAKEQQRTRKLYFAQSHRPPYHGRVCVAPPGCLLSSSPDGPNKGSLYVPSEKAAPKAKLSVTSGFNPCGNASCGKPAVRPLVDTGAMVFVVFGILGVNRTRRTDNHVIGDMGSVVYDEGFDLFKEIGNLCRICKTIAKNAELVKPGGAQCLPSDDVQGEVVLPDLFRLSQVGDFPSRSAPSVSGRLRLAQRLPDLRALEADLHGDHRCSERSVWPHPVSCDLRGRGRPLHHPRPPPAPGLAHHFRRRLLGGHHHVLVRLGDGSGRGHLALHPRRLLGGLLRASGGRVPPRRREFAPSPGGGPRLQPAVEGDRGGPPRGRGHRVQRRHHRHRHRPALLLHHRPLRQIRQDRGPQHGGLHPVHADGQHRPLEHRGSPFLHPEPDFLPQGPGRGADRPGRRPLRRLVVAEERVRDPAAQWGGPIVAYNPNSLPSPEKVPLSSSLSPSPPHLWSLSGIPGSMGVTQDVLSYFITTGAWKSRVRSHPLLGI